MSRRQGRAPIGRRGSHLLATVLAAMVLLPLLILAGPAAPALARTDVVPVPTPGHPWFGPSLDWTKETARKYADDLGTSPSLYTQRVHYPLTDDDATYLREFAQQAAQQGSVAVVSVEPQVALDKLTVADARRFAGELATLHEQLDTFFLVRFAPEMNGSWVIWGQQPNAYKAAFRRVAAAVHSATDQAAMVWAPAYGAGYPFGKSFGSLDLTHGDLKGLDTDGDGKVTEADDPYGPYYPGNGAVDWVGLSLYHFGESRNADPTEQYFAPNRVPPTGSFQARLDETWGYGTAGGRTPFYQRFAVGRDKPMLVETGAGYEPGAGGAAEQQIKQSWWRQVLASESSHPMIGAISWLELTRKEAEAEDHLVEWGATRTPALAGALHTDLAASPTRLGPVTRKLDLQTSNAATVQGNLPAKDHVSAEMGWICLCAVILGVAFLVAGLVGRFVPSWRYPNEHDPRDRRLDLFRGWIILAVVITHIEVNGLYSYITLNAIGAITGAEMFVLLSGVVLGMVYPVGVRRFGEWAAAVGALRRARKLYLVALVVVLLVYVLGKIPGIDASVITTFTDRGTGQNGQNAQGLVYDLYPNAARLFDYPPPWYAVKELLLLEIGPWVFNIMGLFVVLSLALPAVMWLILRRLWWVVLAISWALFIWAANADVHWLPSQFEDVFPLFTWQIAFTHGLVLGYYRNGITRALTTTVGKLCCGVFVVGYAAALGWLWLGHRAIVWSPYPDAFYGWAYNHLYTRVFLQPGRLVDLVLMTVVAFAFLTTVWKPVNAVIGWLWIPLGQASLYVFTVHVFLVLAVANIPHLDRMSWWQGTLVHTVAILIVWAMVRKRFLFKLIPS
ncbi:OpgC domain-containing protein [Nocardioides sp. BP30]|uniref:OpgC domain-containing protein n=1 Tax=Nocardioides sp. BP30 TaxID=3036374 RepID=UPI002468E384|nr:OpgC domain-containing protein [Nocardioides sp. BP30]WGL50589.1 OpgC domain-containing protein [Nocardioides sp. BP30]